VIAPGQIEHGGKRMLIGAAGTGTVIELPVQAGAHVKPSQLLARLDCVNLEKELQTRTSLLAGSEAALTRVTHGPRPEEIVVVASAVALAKARAEQAEGLLRRLTPSEGSEVTEAQLDQARRDARIAAAQLEEAHAKEALVRAGSAREDVLETQSRRDAAKAAVDEAEARLNYCSVRAPASGIVLHVDVTLGQLVSAAVPVTLLTLVDDDSQIVRAEVREQDIGGLCLKQRAVITSESLAGQHIDAVIERISDRVARRTIANRAGAEADDDVRTVTLSLMADKHSWPVGLHVSVSFSGACAGGQAGGPT
jgi:multidrug resistance efflux pump